MKNKKTKIAIIAVIALVLVTIGITYAYWLITRTQEGENVITTGCLDITLTDGADDITLTDQFPLSDEEGMNLTPYTFTVTNNCNTSVDYQVALEAIEVGDEIASSALKVALDDKSVLYSNYTVIGTTVEEAYEARKILVATLAPKDTEGSTKTHELRIWIDEKAAISEMNKIFKSKITVTVGQGIENPYKEGTLAANIVNLAKEENYLKTETPDFSKSTATGEFGLYSSYDDYGESYYFRGDTENNYVKFGTFAVNSEGYGFYPEGYEYPETKKATLEECQADLGNYPTENCVELGYKKGAPLYWRIVRVNGDGTIRLIYDGALMDELYNAYENKYFNEGSDNEKYLGYTYDNGDGTQTDSNAKKEVDAWYTKYLKESAEKYLSDNIFCNNKEVQKVEYYDMDGNLLPDSQDYIEIIKRYASVRLFGDDKMPILSCKNESDRYTVNAENGNGLLSNPIGMLTGDEAFFAGVADDETNSKSYLADVWIDFWTMTPSLYQESYGLGNASMVTVEAGGKISAKNPNVDSRTVTMRPVINLKADLQFTGNGTIDSPYEIVMN